MNYRSLFASIGFVACSLPSLPVAAADEEIKFRYYAAYGKKGGVYQHFAKGGSAKGYKLCTTKSWSPLYSAKPDLAKEFSVAIVHVAEVFRATAGKVCDVAALRLSAKRGVTPAVLDKRARQFGYGMVPIPALNVD